MSLPKAIIYDPIDPNFRQLLLPLVEVVTSVSRDLRDPGLDLYVIDVDLQGIDGLELCRRIANTDPNSNILVLLTKSSAHRFRYKLNRLSFRAILLKTSPKETLLIGINQAACGVRFDDPALEGPL